MNEIVPIIGIVFLAIGIALYFQRKKDEEEVVQVLEQERKDKLANLIETQEERVDLELIDSKVFWKMIDSTKERSSGNYKKQMGLLNDRLKKFSSEELIRIDNFYKHIEKDALTWDILAAANIIFPNSGADMLSLLISMAISRGEVIYNNISVNPNILINQDFSEIEPRTIPSIIANNYFLKENKLMPILQEEVVELQGEKWDRRDLPSRYKELWNRFA